MSTSRRSPRAVRRVTAAATTLAAVAASFAVGAWWAGGPSAPSGSPFRLAGAELRPAADCAALLDHYVEGTLDQVGPYGWGGWGTPWPLPMYSTGGGVVALSRSEATTAAPSLEGQAGSATGTNVQEAGVDEPDVVKTDGRLLVRVEDGAVTTYDVTGPAPDRLGSVDLPTEVADPELLLVGDRVVVLGTGSRPGALTPWGPWWPQETTHQVDLDVSDADNPVVTRERSWNARLVSARQHGTTVRLVLAAGLPRLDFVRPRRVDGEQSARQRNRDVLRRSTIEDWIPSVSDEDGTRPVADCADVAVPRGAPATGGLYVVGFDAAVDEEAPDAVTGIATATETAYASADRLYVATGGPTVPMPGCCLDGVAGTMIPPIVEEWGRTSVHAFALDGVETTYVASGEVDGVVADRWAMDEHDGVLRLAVGPGGSRATADANSVLALEERGGRLVQVGAVHGLGVGEEIKSVRWYDELAVVVTFRVIDPLYAVDLTDPRAPRALGELKIPGFSSYLHPLDDRRLLGMGEAAPGSAQAAVFDLADLTRPVQEDVVAYGPGTWAAAGADPRQFTWLPDRRTALTVVSSTRSGGTAWVSVLRVDGGRLDNRMVPVPFGSDPTTVRTLPLPDGRVVLVADEVTLLDL